MQSQQDQEYEGQDIAIAARGRHAMLTAYLITYV